ncbi:EAL domain-containing protein [Thiobaca trueperi]|uniref:cyclic-guanylate-specific phosphodiesterase n=1 Tax=Thiobaca trueperi TaxID=127458 RepID=A0A4R3N0E0_9GAMM|nr:EAL domain-containing protein [Thiobaca trueperi]TCT21356.1 PAS domain S-box-containing protein/diguanylate cyclase (GGDEF)-like protein [Thiobaca trueperi]
MRVLHVEDNPVDVDLTRRLLFRQAPEIQLEPVSTLVAARACLQTPDLYDLALVDLKLPDGSGLELLTEIRERTLPLAVVMLTGSGDPEAAIAALQAGADDYLAKGETALERLPTTLRDARKRFREAHDRHAHPLRVLYAEHNLADIDLTRRHLARYAPHVRLTPVTDVARILTRLPSNPHTPCDYDLVLLDYRLPGLDALEAVKILRAERGLDIPIVMVSGQGSEAVAAQAMHLGVNDYLSKHHGYLHKLPAILDKALSQTRLARERATLRETAHRLELALAASQLAEQTRETRLAVLDGLVENQPLENILDRIITRLEAIHPDLRVSIQLPSEDPAIQDAAAPLDASISWPIPLQGTPDQPQGRFTVTSTESRTLSPDEINQIDEFAHLASLAVVRVSADARLRQAAAVFESTHEGVIITDLQTRILTVNRAYTEITGYSEDEVHGRQPNISYSGRQDRGFYQTLWSSVKASGHWHGEIWNRRKNGEIYPALLSISTVYDSQNQPSHYVGIITDISQIKESEARLEHLVHYDPLTNLPNRRLVQSRLQHALEQAERQRWRLAVLFLDLDRFKNVNDSLGHPVGDELLEALARRLSARLREDDTLGRLGGDEFLLLLERLARPEDAADVAQMLLQLLEQPFILPSGPEIYIGASIGISLYPDDGHSVTELIKHADVALYQAKEQGRNTYRFYTPTLTTAANERLALDARLRRALANGEFVLHYQPQFESQSGALIGCEALVRWLSPEEGMISPARFIPLAEDTGLIVPLGEWVLRTACAQGRVWLDAGLPALTIAVNLSGRQLQQPDLVQRVADILEQTGLPGERLKLELTESMIMGSGDQTLDLLRAIKALGPRLSIDDFGTGYSSLAYLKRFPIDELKIDQSFVRDIPQDESDMEIAATIIAMARNLHLKVIAEGVETPEQLAFLTSQGCHACQGYLLGHPVPANEFVRTVFGRASGLHPV